MDYQMDIEIKAISPICLGSGNSNIVVDSDVTYDTLGVPYFPAKRLKGLLYESAVEMAEIMEAGGLKALDMVTVNEAFNHGDQASAQMIIHDFYLKGFLAVEEQLQWLEDEFPDCIQPGDVLEEVTSLRYQTAIDENGVAQDTSLRNIRVLDENNVFSGEIILIGAEEKHLQALCFALRNLQYAGMKRNRGLGKIECRICNMDMDSILKKALERR